MRASDPNHIQVHISKYKLDRKISQKVVESNPNLEHNQTDSPIIRNIEFLLPSLLPIIYSSLIFCLQSHMQTSCMYCIYYSNTYTILLVFLLLCNVAFQCSHIIFIERRERIIKKTSWANTI